MKYTEDAYTLCPFYHKESKNSIICEGIDTDTTNIIRFGIDKKYYKNRYCRSRYEDCKLQKILMSKYTD